MLDLVLTITCFVMSAVIFFKMHAYFIHRKESMAYQALIQRRISGVARQQDIFIDFKKDGFSAFKKKQDNFDMGLGQHKNFFEEIVFKMHKANLNISLFTFFLICFILSIIFTCALVYFDFFSITIAFPAGIVIGFFVMMIIINSMIEKKKHAFIVLFPDAIDMMIRGVKAGLNISRIIKLVSFESKDPISSIFRNISQKMDMGMKSEKVLNDTAEELDIEEFRFLSIALILQIENGGMLAEILTNLSTLVRKRLEFELKVKTMSSEARLNAIVLSALPFAFGGIMALAMPNHIDTLFTTGTGKTLLRVFGVLYVIGVSLMIRATKIKI